MLTLEKVRTYQRFDRDLDGWARSPHSGRDPAGMTDGDWYQIDSLRQGLTLVAYGHASAEFRAGLEQRMLEFTTDEETREALRLLAAPTHRRAGEMRGEM